jgi:glutamate racemase
LTEHDLAANTLSIPSYEFLATGDAREFETLAKRFLGPEVSGVGQMKRESEND